MRLFFSNDVQQIPGPIRQHDAMNFRIVLHSVEQMIERFLRRALRQRGKSLLRFAHVLLSHRFAQDLAAHLARREARWLDRVQDLIFAPAALLNAIGISVEHFEDWQRLRFGGQLLRHVQCRPERHHGMKTDVILAAEGARIGERSRGGQAPQIGPRTQLLHQCRQ